MHGHLNVTISGCTVTWTSIYPRCTVTWTSIYPRCTVTWTSIYPRCTVTWTSINQDARSPERHYIHDARSRSMVTWTSLYPRCTVTKHGHLNVKYVTVNKLLNKWPVRSYFVCTEQAHGPLIKHVLTTVRYQSGPDRTHNKRSLFSACLQSAAQETSGDWLIAVSIDYRLTYLKICPQAWICAGLPWEKSSLCGHKL